jgi:hypothetical protein
MVPVGMQPAAQTCERRPWRQLQTVTLRALGCTALTVWSAKYADNGDASCGTFAVSVRTFVPVGDFTREEVVLQGCVLG